MISPLLALTLWYRQRLLTRRGRWSDSPVRSEGQRSVGGDLDGNIGGQSASDEAQESRNGGGEMHFSDKGIKVASYNESFGGR